MTTMFLSGAAPSSTPQADSFLTGGGDPPCGGALSIPPGSNALCLSPGGAPSLVSSNSVAQQPRSGVAQAAAEAAAPPSRHGSALMRPGPCQWRPWQPGPTPMADADVAAPITFLALDGGGGGGHIPSATTARDCCHGEAPVITPNSPHLHMEENPNRFPHADDARGGTFPITTTTVRLFPILTTTMAELPYQPVDAWASRSTA